MKINSLILSEKKEKFFEKLRFREESEVIALKRTFCFGLNFFNEVKQSRRRALDFKLNRLIFFLKQR